jgi:hypothetical protein
VVDGFFKSVFPVIITVAMKVRKGITVGEDNRITECGTKNAQEVDSVDIDDNGFTTVRTRQTKQAKHALRISKKVNNMESNKGKSVSRAILLKQSS